MGAIDADGNPCEDVTFGECDRPDKIVLSKTSQTVQLCNADCYVRDNCTYYRYNNLTKECTLMSAEYRGSYCYIWAAPMDKNRGDCMKHGQNNSQTCDLHLEEDCEYNGELLRRYLRGQIDSPEACQQSCIGLAPKCKYWIFNWKGHECILKRDGRKRCTVWGGPKQPSFDHC